MTLLRRLLPTKGFTLIELLVVIAIIALLAAILTPAINTALLKGKLTQSIANGRGLYVLLFSQEMDNPLGLASKASADWPTTADGYTESTTYFAELVTNDAFNLSYNFFAAPGIEPAQNVTEFTTGTELRNAWCITLDVSEKMDATTPVLFTQNITLSAKDLLSFQELNATADPFGERGAIVVTRGGAAWSMDPNTALGTNFNQTGATNAVLYPLNGQL